MWTHVGLLIVVVQTNFIIQNMFEGEEIIINLINVVKVIPDFYRSNPARIKSWRHLKLISLILEICYLLQWFYLNVSNFSFSGLIWFIVPLMMIVCNDFWAYMFGFFFGKTPLIKLSPKKTWEGFIGGGISTLIFGLILSFFLCQYQYFVCPVKYSEVSENIVMECDPSFLFKLQEYRIEIVRNIYE